MTDKKGRITITGADGKTRQVTREEFEDMLESLAAEQHEDRDLLNAIAERTGKTPGTVLREIIAAEVKALKAQN